MKLSCFTGRIASIDTLSHCTSVVKVKELLVVFRSWVCARTLKLLTSLVPAAAFTLTRIVTAIVCAGILSSYRLWSRRFASAEAWYRRMARVPPQNWNSRSWFPAREYRLTTTDFAVVRSPDCRSTYYRSGYLPGGLLRELWARAKQDSAAMTTLAMNASLFPLSPGWKASGVTGKSAALAFPPTHAFQAGSTHDGRAARRVAAAQQR